MGKYRLREKVEQNFVMEITNVLKIVGGEYSVKLNEF